MSEIAVELQDRSTHATRHPEKDVIPPQKDYTKTTRAERETANVRRQLKRERDEDMKKEIDVFREQRESFAVQMAMKFNIKVEKARDLLNSSYIVKTQRKPSTFNAIVSHRAKELNDGLRKGNRLPLERVQEIVMEEIEEGKYTIDEIEAMKDELLEQRELKTKGARCSNRAAAVDHHATLRHLEAEMGNLHERVGTVGFAFFSRGHINDSIIPGWIDSQGAVSFVKDVLQTTPEELANKFELWACTKDRGKRHVMRKKWLVLTAKSEHKAPKIGMVRGECVNIVSRGLREITGLSNVTMHYENYEVDVVLKYGAVLKGWPPGVKFQSPAKITRMEDACILRDALLSGKRKRGEESVSEDDDEKAMKSKKRRERGTKDKASIARKLPPMPKSSEFISLTLERCARQKLEAFGVKIDDTEFKDVLLMNLDESFHAIRLNILAQSPEPDLEKVKVMLTSSTSADSVSVKLEGANAARGRGTSRSTTPFTDDKGYR
ncbi:hypothetical protein H0H92_005288, partial [Tricholoma furcatifolium]